MRLVRGWMGGSGEFVPFDCWYSGKQTEPRVPMRHRRGRDDFWLTSGRQNLPTVPVKCTLRNKWCTSWSIASYQVYRLFCQRLSILASNMRLKGLCSAIAQAAAKGESILAAYAAVAVGDSNQRDNTKEGAPSPKINSSSSSSTKHSRKRANSGGGAAAATASAGKKDKGTPPYFYHLVHSEQQLKPNTLRCVRASLKAFLQRGFTMLVDACMQVSCEEKIGSSEALKKFRAGCTPAAVAIFNGRT